MTATASEEDDAWGFLRELARAARSGVPASRSDVEGRVQGFSDAGLRFLEMYLPLCEGARAPRLVVAHLGQSLDGRVSTPSGASRFITGPSDVKHTHRMRALFDAVVVGRATVAMDDPRLTPRLVDGEAPLRVVIDPEARLGPDHFVFRDGKAKTLVVTREDRATLHAAGGPGVEVLGIPSSNGCLNLVLLLAALRERGAGRVFIEGGGATVTRFLDAGLLDRLQVAVAPKIIGTGRPAIDLSREVARSGTRVRSFMMAPDILFECDFRAGDAEVEVGGA